MAYLDETGIDDDIDRALAGCDHVYIAFDCDVLRPGELDVFMPEPGGPTVAEAEAILREVVAARPVAGMGVTGLREGADTAVVARLVTAAGL